MLPSKVSTDPLSSTAAQNVFETQLMSPGVVPIPFGAMGRLVQVAPS